ncbi:penicillin acylase family protein [Halopseudomonas pachastrellae]|nr:penicillin acylase family protein [Halopseudomonas pachastrellae]
MTWTSTANASTRDDPEQVWAVDRWQKLQVHEEVIKIRGQEDRLIRTRSSRHGPIVNDLPGSLEREPVSLFWSFLDPGTTRPAPFTALPAPPA